MPDRQHVGRAVIVTGAGSGFGAGIAATFVREGANVLVADINFDAARDVAASLGDAALAVHADVCNGDSVEALARTCLDRYGRIDVLVNNAGTGHTPQPLEALPEDTFETIVAVNMRAVYLLARVVVPVMKAQKSGVIVNIASTAGVSPRPNLTWYNASKGWLITATRSMAVELAPAGIRVNAVNPVAGETPMLATFMGGDTPELRQKFLSTIPLGRFSTPADIGEAASFLASDAASLITGVTLEVDGGRTV